MTNLTELNQQTTEQLSHFNDQIQAMEKQLREMQTQMRQMTQMSQAQQQLTKEWENNSLSSVRKHLRDSTSVYQSQEAIAQMRDDLNTICDEVLENFEEYQQSNRYLDQFEAEEQDNQPQEYSDYNLLVEVSDDMPPEDEDSPLNPDQVQSIIQELDSGVLAQIKQMLGISGRLTKMSSIATEISNHQVSKRQIDEMLRLIESQSLLLAGFNGNGNGRE